MDISLAPSRSSTCRWCGFGDTDERFDAASMNVVGDPGNAA